MQLEFFICWHRYITLSELLVQAVPLDLGTFQGLADTVTTKRKRNYIDNKYKKFKLCESRRGGGVDCRFGWQTNWVVIEEVNHDIGPVWVLDSVSYRNVQKSNCSLQAKIFLGCVLMMMTTIT